MNLAGLVKSWNAGKQINNENLYFYLKEKSESFEKKSTEDNKVDSLGRRVITKVNQVLLKDVLDSW